MAGRLRFSFDAGKLCVLAHLPVGIGAFRERIAVPVVNRGPSVPFILEAGKNRLDLIQKLSSPSVGIAFVKAVSDQAAGVIYKNS